MLYHKLFVYAAGYTGMDYAPLLHALNVYRSQYNTIIEQVKKRASKLPKSLGAPLKAGLTACTAALG